MKLIILTRGFRTVVDDDLYEELNLFNWYASGIDGRAARRLRMAETSNRRIILMYHQILNVDSRELNHTGYVVDHIDRNPLNNQKHNLRIVKQIVNMQNSLRSINRLGVGRDSRHNTWKAYIDQPFQPRINIGTFKTQEEAQDAVKAWHGGVDVRARTIMGRQPGSYPVAPRNRKATRN